MPPSFGDENRRQQGVPGRRAGRPRPPYDRQNAWGEEQKRPDQQSFSEPNEEELKIAEAEPSSYPTVRRSQPSGQRPEAQPETETAPRIDPGKRAVALIIDLLAWYLVGAILNVLPLLVHLVSMTSIWILLLLTRDFWFEGRGIGKNFMGMMVIDAKTGHPCSFKQSVLRNIIILAPCAVLPIISVILTFVPLDWLREAVKSVTNVVGAIYLVVVLPMECYRAYSRDDSLRLGDSWAGTEIVEANMDFRNPFSRSK
jgi:hypothetical protein